MQFFCLIILTKLILKLHKTPLYFAIELEKEKIINILLSRPDLNINDYSIFNQNIFYVVH